jgi:hypothetical protein
MERKWYDSRQGERFFSSPRDPDRRWDPSTLLLDRIKSLLSGLNNREIINLITDLHLVLKLRITGNTLVSISLFKIFCALFSGNIIPLHYFVLIYFAILMYFIHKHSHSHTHKFSTLTSLRN